jgi:putative transposase
MHNELRALAQHFHMSYVRLWVHLVFTTKNREPILSADLRKKMMEHIVINARSKDIFLDSVGWSEHLHLLISLGREQNIAKVAMLIKGESAHWFNRQIFIRGKFHWQDDYFALSVSESQLDRVRAYIRTQEDQHRAKPFADEFEALMNVAAKGLG